MARAEIRAEQLCDDNQWSHDGWTNSFSGLKVDYLGENLAIDFKNATSTHKGLMASPTHKANIVNPVYTQIGVGYSERCNLSVELFSSDIKPAQI